MNNFINEFKEKDSELKKRVGLIKFCIFLFLIVISIKIFSLQLINNEEPLKFSKIQTNPFQLLGNRGEIRDADGRILAVSVAYPSIHLNPREIKDKVYYSKILSKTLNISEAEVLKKLNKKKYFVWIKRLASHKEGEENSFIKTSQCFYKNGIQKGLSFWTSCRPSFRTHKPRSSRNGRARVQI